MKIALHGELGLPVVRAFFDSLGGCCDTFPFSVPPRSVKWEKYDLIIANGVRPPVAYVKEFCEKHSIKFLAQDLGFIGRPDYWQIGPRLGWLPRFVSHDRLEKLNLTLGSYEPAGKCIVVAGQKANDSSHNMSAAQLSELYNNWIADLKYLTDMPVIFRQHPKEKDVDVDCVYDQRSKDESLSDAALVVTWNSTFAVDAIIAGVPIWTGDPTCQSRALSSNVIYERRIPTEKQRLEHLARVAYAQWTLDEIRSGECLSTILEKLL